MEERDREGREGEGRGKGREKEGKGMGKGREGEGKDPHCFLDKSNPGCRCNISYRQVYHPCSDWH